MHDHNNTSELSADAVIVGIDWANAEHVLCLIGPDGRLEIDTLQQSPAAIDEWAADLQRRFPGRTIAVALEQSKGALIYALMKYEHILLYSINPKQLARYREALYPSGSKDDPTDAALLAQFLGHHSGQLRPWKPDNTATRKLAGYTEHRRKIVEERKRLSQQLTSRLKLYFPLVIELFPRNIERTAALVKRWDTLAKLRRVHPKTLRTFLKQQGVRNDQKRTEIIEAIRAAVPLTTDEAIVEPNALFALSLAKQIEQLNQTIDQFDEQIARLVAAHDDAALFRALPGAGDALVPRLIAAMGSDRDRYNAAEEIQCHSGIAPVTRQSGKTRNVSRRYACPKFLRQTFHEFADHARKWSAWSKAFYQMKIAAGFKHHAAVRALAYKWIRIIFHLWKTHTLYDENVYIKQLRKRNSPIVNFLETA
ncbi:MAG: IS110 family transposase [Planctomycetes bacterium]|nr:IS110 family transposase [Planctomycetota bacterium]